MFFKECMEENGTAKGRKNTKEEHLITYKSRGNSSQIYFTMTRRADLSKGNAILQGNTQRGGCISASAAMWNHDDKRKKHKKRTREKTIKIWTLKGEKVTEYRDKVEEE